MNQMVTGNSLAEQVCGPECHAVDDETGSVIHRALNEIIGLSESGCILISSDWESQGVDLMLTWLRASSSGGPEDLAD